MNFLGKSKSSFHLFGFGGDDDSRSGKDNVNTATTDMEASNKKLIEEKVFNQDDVDEDNENFDTLDDAMAPAADVAKPVDKQAVWDSIVQLMTGGKENALENIISIVSNVMASQLGDLSTTESVFSADDFKKVITTLLEQVRDNFEDVPIFDIDPLAFVYYLEKEDRMKNPSWKRRLHRFMPSIKLETVYGLHDALYLSQLSYVDTVEEVQHGLQSYKGAKYELVYCTTEGRPQQPANILVIKKEGSVPGSKKHNYSLLSKKEYVECVLIVRGTKTLEDMFSDALLEATPYRDGMAHHGVCQSGLYLVQKHTDALLNILKMSGRDKVKLTILGHSLGAVRCWLHIPKPLAC
jgi:hypothetical protein